MKCPCPSRLRVSNLFSVCVSPVRELIAAGCMSCNTMQVYMLFIDYFGRSESIVLVLKLHTCCLPCTSQIKILYCVLFFFFHSCVCLYKGIRFAAFFPQTSGFASLPPPPSLLPPSSLFYHQEMYKSFDFSILPINA